MPSAPLTARALVSTILAAPLSYANEAQLQAQLAATLAAAGYEVEREVVLDDGVSRIDLQVGRIGIEVKVKGSLPDIRRQLARYARDEGLDELILVTTRAAHHGIPTTLGGKPLTLCSLVGMRL
jgi:hypothetical protein